MGCSGKLNLFLLLVSLLPQIVVNLLKLIKNCIWIGDLRVCTYCCKVVLSYLQSASKDVVLSPDLISLRNELQVKLGNNEILTNYNVTSKYFENIIETTNSPSRKISVGYQEENFALSK